MNIRNIPNGHYQIYCLRISEPVCGDSSLGILGKANDVYININHNDLYPDSGQNDLKKLKDRKSSLFVNLNERVTTRFEYTEQVTEGSANEQMVPATILS